MNSNSHKTPRIVLRTVLLTTGTLAVVVLIWWAVQPVFIKLDAQANRAFYDKAKALDIQGREKAFVIANFGSPKYVDIIGDREIWKYVPGPKCAFWNSYCKIVFDRQSQNVVAWQVASD